ncbi:MAG: hypothetical protein K2X48_08765 [Chitinophagaceae bacterium]|nr:hypothetical protein [Chitinophagaceae bacterium]
MRNRLLFTAFIITLFSCTQKNDVVSAKIDHVSKWFILHEDSLYKELEALSVKELDESKSCYTSNEQPINSLMEPFTNEVKRNCDGLEVAFTYCKKSNPKATVFLPTNYDRRWSKALDTIFNFFPSSKYFKIIKYEQCICDTTTDILTLDAEDVILKNFRVSMSSFDTLQNIVVYIPHRPINTKLSERDIAFLRQQLLGEELYVRRINQLEFKFCDTIKSHLLTISETRNRLR